ncbi:MAG: glutathione S-transferase C-terminal domain-containing protein [Alphaproteobacteria bacterium]|nr:glutathione S-transferase C-terminal domain-containing protein [Alphaproteobacteria bacterium]
MWTVGELDLAAERIDAGMQHGVVNELGFGARNPNHLVPTTEDDGLTLWESKVIVRYLAARFAQGTLMPDGPAARATAEMWMDWQQNTIMTGLSPLFVGLIRTPPEQRDAAAIRAGAENVEAAMRILDQHLAGRSFMVADHLSVADIPVGCCVCRWYALPIERPQLRHLRGWYERLTARPAFAEHVMLPLT